MKTLKNKTIFAIVALALLFSSCDGVLKNATVNIPIEPAPFEFQMTKENLEMEMLKAPAQDGEIVLANFGVNTDLRNKLKEEGYIFENLKNFSLDKSEIEIVTPKSFDINKLVGIKLFINNALIASSTKNSSNNRLVLTVNQPDLIKYIDSSDEFMVTIKGKNEIVEKGDINAKLFVKFTAKVSVKKE